VISMSRKKGQSFLFSHSILVGFGVILIFIVMVAFTNLHNDFQNFVAKNELQQACIIVQGGIEKIYLESGYRSPTEGIYGTIDVNLPDRIAGMPYSVYFVNSTIRSDAGEFSYACGAGFNARYQGSSSGGITQIVLFRNFTETRIEMRSV
jgi:hypothetical protein